MRTITALVLAAALALPIFSVNLRPVQSEPTSSGASAAAAASHGVALSSMDKTCKPCQDFFGYATGEWRKKNPIPPAYPNWSPAYELVERNREHLHQILEKAAADHQAAPGSNEQKIGDFYSSCMNEQQVNAEGVKPLEPELERIAAMANIADLQAEVARLQGMGVEAVFDF